MTPPGYAPPALGEIGLDAMRRLTESTSPHVPAAQRWFWDPEWQAGEREASAEIAAGGLKAYDSMAELLAELDAPHDGEGPAGATT